MGKEVLQGGVVAAFGLVRGSAQADMLQLSAGNPFGTDTLAQVHAPRSASVKVIGGPVLDLTCIPCACTDLQQRAAASSIVCWAVSSQQYLWHHWLCITGFSGAYDVFDVACTSVVGSCQQALLSGVVHVCRLLWWLERACSPSALQLWPWNWLFAMGS